MIHTHANEHVQKPQPAPTDTHAHTARESESPSHLKVGLNHFDVASWFRRSLLPIGRHAENGAEWTAANTIVNEANFVWLIAHWQTFYALARGAGSNMGRG